MGRKFHKPENTREKVIMVFVQRVAVRIHCDETQTKSSVITQAKFSLGSGVVPDG